jgi:hypothetical protein
MFDGIEALSVNTDNKTGRQSSKFNYHCLVISGKELDNRRTEYKIHSTQNS